MQSFEERARPRIQPRMPRWLAYAGALGLLAFSFLPLETKERIGTRGSFHGLGHLVAFGILSALLLWSSRSRRQACLSAVFALSLGLGIEWLQAVITGAHVEQHDGVLDAAAVIGVSAIYALTQMLRRRNALSRGR